MIMRAHRFERLFRQAASLDVDKDDLKRLSNFLGKKIYDLLVVAERNAKYNARDVVYAPDVPVTRGLAEAVRAFEQVDVAPELEPVLEHLAGLPPLDLEVGEEVRALLPKLAGALVVAAARVLRELDPDVKNPRAEHWERLERVFDQLI